MDTENDAGKLARTERSDDATAGLHSMAQSEREFVGEEAVERNRQRHVADNDNIPQASNSPML